MFRSILKSYVKIKISNGECIRFLNLCHNRCLNIWNIHSNENGFEFCCDINSFFDFKEIRRKTHVKIDVVEKKGIVFKIRSIRLHGFYFAGIIMCILIVRLLSNYVWSVKVDGNYSHTTEEIIEYLNSIEINAGIKIKDLDYEAIERKIRNDFNDIAWVSVEIDGSNLNVHIKENYDSFITSHEEKPYDIVSNVDGTISKLIVRAGTPMFKKGDEIKKNDVIVSGILNIYDDNGEVIKKEGVNADADIFVKYSIVYDSSVERNHKVKVYTGKKNEIYGLDIFDKSFYFSLFDKKFQDCDKIEEIRRYKLGENSFLPLHTSKISIKEYELIDEYYTEDECVSVSNEKINQFIKKLEEKGIQILENNVKIEVNEKKCIAKGEIIIEEKIGIVSYIDEKSLEMTPRDILPKE